MSDHGDRRPTAGFSQDMNERLLTGNNENQAKPNLVDADDKQ